jgi:hypothetical protein
MLRLLKTSPKFLLILGLVSLNAQSGAPAPANHVFQFIVDASPVGYTPSGPVAFPTATGPFVLNIEVNDGAPQTANFPGSFDDSVEDILGVIDRLGGPGPIEFGGAPDFSDSLLIETLDIPPNDRFQFFFDGSTVQLPGGTFDNPVPMFLGPSSVIVITPGGTLDLPTMPGQTLGDALGPVFGFLNAGTQPTQDILVPGESEVWLSFDTGLGPASVGPDEVYFLDIRGPILDIKLVPLPAAFPLLLAALVGLRIFRKWQLL